MVVLRDSSLSFMDAISNCKVGFGATNYGPMWSPVVASWLRAVGYASRYLEVQQLGGLCGVGVTDRQYTHMAENQLVQDFLNIPDLTHLFLTESDMILPHDIIPKLLTHDKDIVSGIYFLRTRRPEWSGQPCLYKRVVIDPSKQGEYGQNPIHIFPTMELFKADCAGLGCVLIKRHVFEKLTYPWFDLNATKYGSDMYFYKHAKDAGFQLWVDPTVQSSQIDYYEVTIDDWKWRIENDVNFRKMGFVIGSGEGTTGS